MGSGKFSGVEEMIKAIRAANSDMCTVALRRMKPGAKDGGDIVASLKADHIRILPNTSGARNAEEAILAAELAREVLDTHWLKLEIHPDPRYLLPDTMETVKAAEELVKRGFVVLPYIHADPVACKRLEEVGTQAVMPLAAPIGSNAGLQMRGMLEIIIDNANVPVIVDAGLGLPSHAADAMEMGASAVLVNTAIAAAADSAAMATAFSSAVSAGRRALLAGPAGKSPEAIATSPLTDFA